MPGSSSLPAQRCSRSTRASSGAGWRAHSGGKTSLSIPAPMCGTARRRVWISSTWSWRSSTNRARPANSRRLPVSRRRRWYGFPGSRRRSTSPTRWCRPGVAADCWRDIPLGSARRCFETPTSRSPGFSRPGEGSTAHLPQPAAASSSYLCSVLVPRTISTACSTMPFSTSSPSRTPPGLPGRLTIRVLPRTPATPRDKAARGKRG